MMSGEVEESYIHRGKTYVAKRQDPSLREWQVYRLERSDGVQVGGIREEGDYMPFGGFPNDGRQLYGKSHWPTLKRALQFVAEGCPYTAE